MDSKDFQILINSNNYKGQIFINGSDEDLFYEIKNFDESMFFGILSFIKKNDSSTKVHINEELAFIDQTIDFKINLSNCIFNELIIFRNCILTEDTDFKDSVFNKKANFKNTKFNKKVRFHRSVFNKTVSFDNTTFKDLADFYDVTFNNIQRFVLTDFLGITIFSHVKFNHQVQFIYNKTSKDTIVSFENAEFKQSLDISRANFWCKLNFWSAKINTSPSELWLYETDSVEKKDNLKHKKAYKVLRETYRIIKDVFQKEGNNIEAISYYMKEMSAYESELKINKNESKFEERLALFFNKQSNEFGTSWTTGLIFTVIVTVFFYSLFLIFLSDELSFDCSWDSAGSLIKHFLEFLNITKWDIKPFGVDFKWAYIFLFVGRIFIGYGYYQTIQAFRKYGKS